jgi:hypothetical protein
MLDANALAAIQDLINGLLCPLIGIGAAQWLLTFRLIRVLDRREQDRELPAHTPTSPAVARPAMRLHLRQLRAESRQTLLIWTCLLAAALFRLLPPARARLRLGLLAGLLFALCWHFAPRVLPPTERRPFFEPPPQVALVQAEQTRATQAPFRVAGYDPLRVHDAQFESPNKFKFLAPNIATVFHVEDITGFDPLMYLRYLDLFLATSGRAPYNDPIRNLDLGRPDPALFDFLGLRFILGNPYDRRLCHLPLTLAPGQPAAEVGEWTPARAEGRAVTHWMIVSLLDRALRVPLGAEVARLVIEADEGTFEFPIRNGQETADLHALNFEPLYKSPAFRAQLNLPWGSNTLDPELHYRVSAANYRAVIPFGRPLHIRRAAWRLQRPDLIFSIAAQAFRLAPAPQDPWALRYGSPDEPAPVFEYTAAKPRAVLVSNPSSSQVPGTPPDRLTSANRSVSAMDVQLTTASLNQPAAPGALEWLDRRPCAMTLHVKSESPSLLVLREMWDAGWKAEVNGRAVPVQRVNGLLRGVAVPAGESQVRFAYRPRLPLALLALAGFSLIFYVIGLRFWRRQA